MDKATCECFYLRRSPLASPARQRLLAYRRKLALYNLTRPAADDVGHAQAVSLLDVLRLERALTVADWPKPRERAATVRFDARSRGLWSAGELIGEISAGSKEYYFLTCLAARLNRFVPYADLKHFVLAQFGSIDATQDAIFCQSLESRIKKEWIPRIDNLIVTTNKGVWYRLRGRREGNRFD